ncbi:MAG: flagellar brake protein [Agathobacter sp.]|nr:flagellar brake protein [Agathobacter sp.]
MGLEGVKPGDKIDINYLHQNNGKTYKSSVFDILSDTELEITMPTDEGKMILFQNGFECQFYFYTSKGLFTCEAVITGRAKRDNFYILNAKIKTGLKKFQRRDYYRVNTLIDFGFYKITDEVAELETTEDLFEEIADPKYLGLKQLARTKDISGGGIKFLVNEPLESREKLLIVIRLTNEKLDHMFYLVAEVIDCVALENSRDKWVARAKWIFKNIKDRDLIVRYVFEEDRMIRKKEKA